MEPLTALSLFCNIVDICDHAIKVCQSFTDIYRSVRGRRTRDEELLTYVGELEGILSSVRISSSRLNKDSSYQAILGPLGRVEAKSAVVKDILDGFRASKPGNRLSTIIATAKVVRGQGKLDRTLQDLKQCRDDIHFAIAQSTRIQLGEIAAHSEQLRKGQCDIQSRLASLENRLQKPDKDLTEVPDIVAKAKEFSEEVHKELCALSILGSLGNTNQRYWDVTEADSHTFHWILPGQAESGSLTTRDEEHESNREDDKIMPKWERKMKLEYERTQSDVKERLRNWLLHGSGLFHISGRPGSGKSTLMKYLVQHPKARDLLEEWARPKRLAVGRFFFWKPDHGQNSLEALLRGLLYSVVHYDSDLVYTAFPKHSKGSYEQLSISAKLDITKDEIFEAFKNLTRDSQTSKRSNFCFFIDDLDELEDEGDTTHSKIVKALQQWTDSAEGYVKICVSSRQFPVFDNMPVGQRIVLQDLTKYDMVKFVYHSLRPHHAVQSRAITDAEDYHELVTDIVERSSGIFLWVSLVMRSVERGVSNGDSIAVLRDRVRNTPKGLEQLFKSLFDSIEDCHAQMALILLAVALAWLPGPRHRVPGPRHHIPSPDLSLSACQNFFHARETSTGDSIDDVFRAENFPEAFKLTSDMVSSTKSKILFQCKGMLEIVPAQTDKDSKHEQYTGGRVTFLHRSISESLTKWVPGRMESEGLNASHVQNAMCWIVWAETHFLNSFIHPQQLPDDDQTALREHIARITFATFANLGTAATSNADLSTSFKLLGLAEDGLLPAIISLSTQEENGEYGKREGHTWDSIHHKTSPCPFLTPLNIAAISGCYAYVCWRVARTSPSVLQTNHFQHCLNGALDVLDPYYTSSEDWIEDCINIAVALIQTISGDINSMGLVSSCNCRTLSRNFNGARALPSVFDTIWILFIFHSQYNNVNCQQAVFGMIESLLVLGASPRSAFCVGTARDWFMISSSPPVGPEIDQFGNVQQIRGSAFVLEGDYQAEIGRLRMICGQDDGIVTLEKLVAYAEPWNMTVILSLIERNFQIENAKPRAVIELSPSERFQAIELKKHGARGDENLVWLEKY